jgi:hypothetical protein
MCCIGWIIGAFFPRTREYLSPSTKFLEFVNQPNSMDAWANSSGLCLGILKILASKILSENGCSKSGMAILWEAGNSAAGGAAGVLLMVFMVCIVVKMVMVMVLRGGTNMDKK